jgi:branched-chain amino acid transport system permease protein
MGIKRYIPVAALVLAAGIIPLLTRAFHADYLLTQLTMSAYYALVALGLCLLLGYAGQISLGQAGFFAIGAYASALLSKAGIDPRLSFVAALSIAAIVAFLIGLPVLRLKGHYLAMATLGFGLVVEKIARGLKLFGGADGISDVPAFPILASLSISGGRASRLPNFVIAFIILAAALALLVNLLQSRAGRALRALHGNEEAAKAMGVDTTRAKLSVFVIAAVLAAAAGSLLTHYNGSIGPGEASVMKSIRYLSIVAVGGLSSFGGTLAVSLLLNFLSLRGAFGFYDDAFFGAILVLVMLLAPDGFSLSRIRLPKLRRPAAGRRKDG